MKTTCKKCGEELKLQGIPAKDLFPWVKDGATLTKVTDCKCTT